MPSELFARRFQGFDWWLVAAVFLLSLIGLAALYSIGLARPETNFLDFKKQLLFFGAGLVLMIAVGSSNYMMYRNSAKLLYAVSLFLLLAVLVFGRTIRGHTGWIVAFGVSFQPVEFAKVIFILFFALFASRQARAFKTKDFFLGSFLIMAAPVALVLLQPDIGSAVVFVGLWFFFMLILGARRAYMGLLCGGIAVVIALSWFFLLKNYQKDRILIFLNPNLDPLNRGYNAAQSVIAVGAGGMTGRGLGYGSQSQLRFLPEMQTDFIFSMIAEELGFVGSGTVIVLFGVIAARLVALALSARDDFALCVIVGTLLLFMEHFVVNVGMNIGIVPVTGIPLPFVSAGGSSMVMNFLLVGVVQSLVRARRAYVTAPLL